MPSTISTSVELYFRDNGGVVEWSFNNLPVWTPLSAGDWPITIDNININVTLIVYFTTNIIFSLTTQYFICNTDNIQFGSSSLEPTGTRPIIYVTNVAGGFRGLVQNGIGSTAGFNEVKICNLEIQAIGTTVLAAGTGWFGSRYFGQGADKNYIINCTTNGDITSGSGGIVGPSAAQFIALFAQPGNLTIRGCSSSGSIAAGGGGIVGEYAGLDGGTVFVDQCYSSGQISATAGGIFGRYAGSTTGVGQAGVTAQNCYSTGLIAANGGGIFGSFAGAGASATAFSCYSQGNISGGAGGILATYAGTSISAIPGNAFVGNCYSSGTIDGLANAGGIVATNFAPSGVTVNNCYTSGFNTAGVNGNGGIFSGNNSLGGNISETNIGNSGSWSATNANLALQGTPTTTPVGGSWVQITIIDPYELRTMGFSPYDLNNIQGDYSLTPLYSQTITAGTSTIASILPPGYDYMIMEINGAVASTYPTITIDSATGAISTTTATAPGGYTIIVRDHINPYDITVVDLTVEEAAAQLGLPVPQSLPPCCEPNVCNKDPQSTNYDNINGSDKRAGKIIDKNVSDFYLGVATGQRTAYSQPVFKSYYDYARYLQSKHR